MPELGLFPLPIVLVPTERIPLHIFEPRYKELIDECSELGEEFGLVLATGDGAVHEIGTRARVVQVAEVLDDGSMNIIVEGGDRFRLLDLTSGRAFTTGIVEPVLDDDEPALAADVERALEVFSELAEVSESDVDVPDPLSPLFDFELTARVDFAGGEAGDAVDDVTSCAHDGADRTARDCPRGGPTRVDAARARRPQRQGHAARSGALLERGPIRREPRALGGQLDERLVPTVRGEACACLLLREIDGRRNVDVDSVGLDEQSRSARLLGRGQVDKPEVQVLPECVTDVACPRSGMRSIEVDHADGQTVAPDEVPRAVVPVTHDVLRPREPRASDGVVVAHE